MIDEMIQQHFFTWIIKKRDERGWNDAELSQAVGISPSYLSLLMNSQRNVTFDFVMGVARAFGESPVEVLRLAGLLPPAAGRLDEIDQEEKELVDLRRTLPRHHQIAILDIVRGLADRFGRKE